MHFTQERYTQMKQMEQTWESSQSSIHSQFIRISQVKTPVHTGPVSSEIYDPCEIPDHAWRVINFVRVGAKYMTLAKFMIQLIADVEFTRLLPLLIYYNCEKVNSWEICQRCANILLAAEHKMQLAYYLRNTDWFRRRSEFGFFDEPFIILFTIFYGYQ